MTWKYVLWPSETEKGTFKIGCSCGKWTFEGTAEEINKAGRGHDDSPWMSHIVTIRGKKLTVKRGN